MHVWGTWVNEHQSASISINLHLHQNTHKKLYQKDHLLPSDHANLFCFTCFRRKSKLCWIHNWILLGLILNLNFLFSMNARRAVKPKFKTFVKLWQTSGDWLCNELEKYWSLIGNDRNRCWIIGKAQEINITTKCVSAENHHNQTYQLQCYILPWVPTSCWYQLHDVIRFKQ